MPKLQSSVPKQYRTCTRMITRCNNLYCELWLWQVSEEEQEKLAEKHAKFMCSCSPPSLYELVDEISAEKLSNSFFFSHKIFIYEILKIFFELNTNECKCEWVWAIQEISAFPVQFLSLVSRNSHRTIIKEERIIVFLNFYHRSKSTKHADIENLQVDDTAHQQCTLTDKVVTGQKLKKYF